MTHSAVPFPSWWNPDEQKFLSSLSKNASMKAGSTPRLCHDAKHLGLQLADQESSTIQLTGQSRHKVDIMGGSNCQDQCVSSESDGDGSCVKRIVEGQMKPVYLLNNPDIIINPSQISHHHSMARVPYPFAEPCFSGLLTNYGQQTIIQPQMVGIAPARVPLPLDLMDDGPIFVNPKQYHGILRRRQSRAKLEAQNKVVKTRKPYLHESRHRHALNRVRGSGGRFVSVRKLQNPDSSATSNTHCSSDCVDLHPSKKMSEFHSHQFQDVASLTTCSDIKHVSNSNNGNGSFRRFSRPMQCNCNGGLVSGGTQHSASVVQ
ncbi:hypothetical protein F2P56_002404 [Juglans regia]|uniref:Nuclear transcription factor Y subunit n=2 Tax=Juglans regia TaxID=51240 RepID=A0A2I4GL49_JUGRE|nr:nuclear transcription factor Y subunit A-3-like [Juglans regia]XP_018844614.1 nuclear transcription factor Y subunit A-3-like [Juglans regia]XP_018844622.1 nuclear transcription factor Y subunit A-3-like [Juglans regia]KAF5481776.1 hypothetical protein F2P56_002404 [Juglans regia]